MSDTSQAEAVLRNGVIFNAESAVVLSAPATWLARSLDLAGTKDRYKQRVKRLVIVESRRDSAAIPAALAKSSPSGRRPLFFCGREVGDALPFPGAAVDEAFGWAPAHPIGDAYRAFKAMPYDAPSYDLAAMHYTANPESGFFQVSEPGTLSVSESGATAFAPGGGGRAPHHRRPLEAGGDAGGVRGNCEHQPPPPPAPRGRGAA